MALWTGWPISTTVGSTDRVSVTALICGDKESLQLMSLFHLCIINNDKTLWHGLNLNWPEWLMAADEDGGVFLGGCPSGKVTNQRWTIDSVAAGVHGSFWCQSSFSTSEPNSQQTHVRKIISIMQFSARHQLIHTVHLSMTGSWHRVFCLLLNLTNYLSINSPWGKEFSGPREGHRRHSTLTNTEQDTADTWL